MICPRCDDTGWVSEHEPETGFVDMPCPECRGTDGDMPGAIADLHDALTQEDAETEGHSHHGLDAAGFLLLAEAHLTRAKDGFGTDQPMRAYMAGEAIVRAILATRHAMKLLKEEPCKP